MDVDDPLRPQFSVWLFFPYGEHMAEARWLPLMDALELAQRCIARPAANAGMILKVAVTDGGDNTVFLWERRKGITWPNPSGTPPE